MHTKILIISVYYNREDMVDESVTSLVSQLEPDMHLLLVDDGSSDSTLQRLQAWQSTNVSIVTHPNMGFVHSIRAGIDAIQSDYIAIHGSGDLSLPGRFRKQADYLDQHPATGVVGCHSHCIYSGGEMPPYTEAKRFSGDAARHMLTRNLFHQGEVMMRRSCYEQVGGYRTFFKFAQDRDLFCRLSQVTQFHVIEEVLYTRYVAVPGSVSGTPSKVLLQRFLSDFACHCHGERLAGRPDPLEQHGSHAALLWTPGLRTRRDIFRRAIRALYLKRPADYRIFRDALRQVDDRLLWRLAFRIADTFPQLTTKFLDTYYRTKLSADASA
jgi:glycosyltransferase involved in cell wall biosynthesis